MLAWQTRHHLHQHSTHLQLDLRVQVSHGEAWLMSGWYSKETELPTPSRLLLPSTPSFVPTQHLASRILHLCPHEFLLEHEPLTFPLLKTSSLPT